MNSEKEKIFDAVKMMREIRDKLSAKYSEHPDYEEKDLGEIRRKYGINYEFKKAS